MRAVGFVGDVKIRDQKVPRHVIMSLPLRATEELRAKYGSAVCDLTPLFIFRQFGGVAVPLRMTPIRVSSCPACVTLRGDGSWIRKARLDDCLDCGNTLRLVL